MPVLRAAERRRHDSSTRSESSGMLPAPSLLPTHGSDQCKQNPKRNTAFNRRLITTVSGASETFHNADAPHAPEGRASIVEIGLTPQGHELWVVSAAMQLMHVWCSFGHVWCS